MNKIFKTAASVSLGTCSYATPTVSVSEVGTEGVLCASVLGTSVEEWKEEDLGW